MVELRQAPDNVVRILEVPSREGIGDPYNIHAGRPGGLDTGRSILNGDAIPRVENSVPAKDSDLVEGLDIGLRIGLAPFHVISGDQDRKTFLQPKGSHECAHFMAKRTGCHTQKHIVAVEVPDQFNDPRKGGHSIGDDFPQRSVLRIDEFGQGAPIQVASSFSKGLPEGVPVIETYVVLQVAGVVVTEAQGCQYLLERPIVKGFTVDEHAVAVEYDRLKLERGSHVENILHDRHIPNIKICGSEN